MKTVLIGALLSLSMLSPVVAWAQDPSTEQLDKARQLFEQGQEAYNGGQYGVALGYYTQAYEIAKKPTILFNIGQCYRKLGKPQEATDSYKKFIQDDPQTQYLGEVEYKIAELAEELKKPKEALEFYERYLQHKVAEDPNEAKAKERVDALKKELGTKGPDVGPADPPTEDGFVKRVLAQPMGKAAVGTLGAGVLFEVLSISQLGFPALGLERNLCESDPPCGLGLLRGFQGMMVAGDVLLLGVTPALFYLANKKSKQDSSETVAKKPNTALRLIPTTTGGFATFSFTPAP